MVEPYQAVLYSIRHYPDLSIPLRFLHFEAVEDDR